MHVFCREPQDKHVHQEFWGNATKNYRLIFLRKCIKLICKLDAMYGHIVKNGNTNLCTYYAQKLYLS